MESITFDQLLQAVSQLQEKLNNIEQLLLQGGHIQPETDDRLTIFSGCTVSQPFHSYHLW